MYRYTGPKMRSFWQQALGEWWSAWDEAAHPRELPTRLVVHWPKTNRSAMDELKRIVERRWVEQGQSSRKPDSVRQTWPPWLEHAAACGIAVGSYQLAGEVWGAQGSMEGTALIVRPWSVCGLRVAVVSSRLLAPYEECGHWFSALRVALSLPVAGATLLIGARSAVAPWAMRWASLVGRRIWLVRVRPDHAEDSAAVAADLWEELHDCTQLADAHGKIVLFPRRTELLTGDPTRIGSMDDLAHAADDAAACALADVVVVLHVRKHGRIACLVERLQRLELPPRIWVACQAIPMDRPLMVSSSSMSWLSRRGGPQPTCEQLWYISSSALTALASANNAHRLEPYLIHWTRLAHGPWPGQSEDGYRDDFLLNRPGKWRSAFDSLLRILRDRRILASSRAIRGGFRVVCFADVRLEELPGLYRFRSHRRRWDFSPYGIAIQRRWLEGMAVRPVIYGDEECWRRLPAFLRPFFQKARSRHGSYDWTVEREWRCCGDCSLVNLPPEAALVFVRTPAEARVASYFSRWPVVALESITEYPPVLVRQR